VIHELHICVYICVIMVIKFQYGIIKQLWRWVMVMVAKYSVYLMLLNSILKMVKMVNFMLYIILPPKNEYICG
jgi:hypothetical protein